MFYSKKFNLLFIASPKTGTVSVHEALEKLDPNGERRIIELGEKTITGKDLKQGFIGHARAREIKEVLGSDLYNTINSIAFVRNPYAKLVSSYFFNKNNKFSQVFRIKLKKNRLKRMASYFLTVLFAKVLPFKLWALLYPYRSNSSYILDYDGKLIVKNLGRTEFLNEDFHKIMKRLNIDASHIVFDKKNTSSHKNIDQYYNSDWFKKKIYNKMKMDIDIYQEICKKLD
jgi:hypothetical protein